MRQIVSQECRPRKPHTPPLSHAGRIAAKAAHVELLTKILNYVIKFYHNATLHPGTICCAGDGGPGSSPAGRAGLPGRYRPAPGHLCQLYRPVVPKVRTGGPGAGSERPLRRLFAGARPRCHPYRGNCPRRRRAYRPGALRRPGRGESLQPGRGLRHPAPLAESLGRYCGGTERGDPARPLRSGTGDGGRIWAKSTATSRKPSGKPLSSG